VIELGPGAGGGVWVGFRLGCGWGLGCGLVWGWRRECRTGAGSRVGPGTVGSARWMFGFPVCDHTSWPRQPDKIICPPLPPPLASRPPFHPHLPRPPPPLPLLPLPPSPFHPPCCMYVYEHQEKKKHVQHMKIDRRKTYESMRVKTNLLEKFGTHNHISTYMYNETLPLGFL